MENRTLNTFQPLVFLQCKICPPNVKMETSSQDSVTTSQPCTEDDILMDLEGCNQLEEMTEFLEIEFLGMRIWQFVGIIMLITLFVIITLCCCFRFRIPRTKQEIDADYVRKKLAKNFTKQLADISDTKMVEMDMKKGELEMILKQFCVI